MLVGRCHLDLVNYCNNYFKYIRENNIDISYSACGYTTLNLASYRTVCIYL
jgi:hypothetical protein